MRRPGCRGDAQWSPALAGLGLFTAAPDAIHPRGIRIADPAVRTNGCGGLLWRYLHTPLHPFCLHGRYRFAPVVYALLLSRALLMHSTV